jgi:hypothetical protein
MSVTYYCYINFFGNAILYRNAPLVLTKMSRALMNIFALHVLLIFFPIVLILYMCEVILVAICLYARNSLYKVSFDPHFT